MNNDWRLMNSGVKLGDSWYTGIMQLEHHHERITPEPEQIRARAGERGGKIIELSSREKLAREQTRDRGEKIIKSVQPDMVQLKMENFSDIYPEKKIHKDERYVQGVREFVGIGLEDNYLEKSLEDLFISGVQLGRWLGNSERHAREANSSAGEEASFTTKTYKTTEYDDFRHCTDAFTLLYFKDKLTPEVGKSFRTLPLGFDVTLSSDRRQILDKLTHFYNDDEELPFGFTHLDYFTDGKKHMNCPIIPRYVIGVGRYDVKDLNRKTGRGERFRLNSAENLQTRFKILSEIRAQNELFEAMLPEDAYDNPSENVKIARAYIEVADRQLNHALGVCANELIQYQALPSEVIEQTQENPLRTRAIIEEFLLQDSREKFLKSDKRWIQHPPKRLDDPFVQIMTYTRKLREAAFAGGSKAFPHIDELKAEMAHNKSILAPKEKKA